MKSETIRQTTKSENESGFDNMFESAMQRRPIQTKSTTLMVPPAQQRQPPTQNNEYGGIQKSNLLQAPQIDENSLEEITIDPLHVQNQQSVIQPEIVRFNLQDTDKFQQVLSDNPLSGELQSSFYQSSVARNASMLENKYEDDTVVVDHAHANNSDHIFDKHRKLFGDIPTQRQLAMRKFLKIKKKGINSIMSDDDRKNIKTLQKFLQGNVFEDTRNRRLEKIVRRTEILSDEREQVIVEDDEEKAVKNNDELNHYFYDHLHLHKEENKFVTQLKHRQHEVEEDDVGCCGLTIMHLHEEDETCHPDDEIDKWTITQLGTFYTIWLPFIVLANLYTSMFYPVYTIISYEAHIEKEFEEIQENAVKANIGMGVKDNHVPSDWETLGLFISEMSPLAISLAVCETFFFSQMILNFFLQANDDDKKPLRESWTTISERYLRGKFIFDLVMLLPLGYIFEHYVDERLLFLWALKGMRVCQLNYYISDNFWNPIIRSLFSLIRTFYAQEDSEENDCVDLLFIQQEIYALNARKLIRLIIQMLFACYFFGTYWYVFSETVKIYAIKYLKKDIDNGQFESWVLYKDNWNIVDRPLREKLITNMYFASTTLSTVGFGDFYPVNDSERLVGAFLLYFGQAGFTNLISQLLMVMDQITSFQNGDDDTANDLEDFINMLTRFNGGRTIDQEFSTQLIEFFKFQSDNAKNNFLQMPEDQSIFDQLPLEQQNEIFNNFVFREFLNKFATFFNFHKSHQNEEFNLVQRDKMQRIKKDSYRQRKGLKDRTDVVPCGLQYPFFTFQDNDYANFITAIFQALEVRQIKQRTMIAQELEECNEVLFVLKGQYSMGFQINKKAHYKINLRDGTVISGFNVLYECRSQYLIKAFTEMECYAIKKMNLKRVLLCHPTFEKALRCNMLNFYDKRIHKPLQKQKKHQIKILRKRCDYHQIIDASDLDLDIVQKVLKHHDNVRKIRSVAIERQAECLVFLKQIEVKMEYLFFYAYKVSQKTEHMQQKFYEEYHSYCIREKFTKQNQAQMLEQLKLVILPYEVYTLQGYKNTFNSLQAYEDDKHQKALSRIVRPQNPYSNIRNMLIKINKLEHPQTMIDRIAIRNVRKNRRKALHMQQHKMKKISDQQQHLARLQEQIQAQVAGKEQEIIMQSAKLSSPFQEPSKIELCSHGAMSLEAFIDDEDTKLRYEWPDELSDQYQLSSKTIRNFDVLYEDNVDQNKANLQFKMQLKSSYQNQKGFSDGGLDLKEVHIEENSSSSSIYSQPQIPTEKVQKDDVPTIESNIDLEIENQSIYDKQQKKLMKGYSENIRNASSIAVNILSNIGSNIRPSQDILDSVEDLQINITDRKQLLSEKIEISYLKSQKSSRAVIIEQEVQRNNNASQKFDVQDKVMISGIVSETDPIIEVSDQEPPNLLPGPKRSDANSKNENKDKVSQMLDQERPVQEHSIDKLQSQEIEFIQPMEFRVEQIQSNSKKQIKPISLQLSEKHEQQPLVLQDSQQILKVDDLLQDHKTGKSEKMPIKTKESLKLLEMENNVITVDQKLKKNINNLMQIGSQRSSDKGSLVPQINIRQAEDREVVMSYEEQLRQKIDQMIQDVEVSSERQTDTKVLQSQLDKENMQIEEDMKVEAGSNQSIGGISDVENRTHQILAKSNYLMQAFK